MNSIFPSSRHTICMGFLELENRVQNYVISWKDPGNGLDQSNLYKFVTFASFRKYHKTRLGYMPGR